MSATCSDYAGPTKPDKYEYYDEDSSRGEESDSTRWRREACHDDERLSIATGAVAVAAGGLTHTFVGVTIIVR